MVLVLVIQFHHLALRGVLYIHKKNSYRRFGVNMPVNSCLEGGNWKLPAGGSKTGQPGGVYRDLMDGKKIRHDNLFFFGANILD